MSYYIVINGSLGCGKSTIAKLLAEKLHAHQVKLDEVLERNDLDQLAPDDAYIPADNFKKAVDIAIPEVKERLNNGQIVIFDGCFYHKEVLDHLVATLPSQHYIFTLKAPLAICIERDKHRAKTLGEDAARAVYRITEENSFGEIIDASGSQEETLSKIQSYLE